MALKSNWKEGNILFVNICEDIRLRMSFADFRKGKRLIGLYKVEIYSRLSNLANIIICKNFHSIRKYES